MVALHHHRPSLWDRGVVLGACDQPDVRYGRILCGSPSGVLLGLAYAYGYCLSSAARLKTPDEYETPIDYEHVVDINRYLTFALVSSLGVWTGLFILDRLTNESGSFDVAIYQLNVIVALVVALIYALRFKFQNVKGKNLRHELKQLKREVRYIHEQLKVLQSP